MTETHTLIIDIMSACTGEKIESIIVDKNHRTINEWFNNFIREKYNDKLYESDIKIIYNLLQIYSYYDQEIGDKSIEKIDLFKNNKNIQVISVLLVFSDPFIYISDIIINPKCYHIESYQNLNDYKKQKINELLNMLHYQYQYHLRDINFIEMIYDHIIITKFIAIVLLKKNHCYLELRSNQLNENFCDDREIIKISVANDGNILQFASEELRADREIVKNALSGNVEVLQFASIDLLSDKEIVKFALSQNGCALKYASIDLRADKEIVKFALSQNGRALEYASIDLRADREIVEIAVSRNCWALEYASINLRADREIVKIAVLQNSEALYYASVDLRADKEFVKIALSQNGEALAFALLNLHYDNEIITYHTFRRRWYGMSD